jgi:mannose-6-phosphate isomerase-like protein (cupin superfamily)
LVFWKKKNKRCKKDSLNRYIMHPSQITIPQAAEALLQNAPLPFVKLMEHGTMSVEYYAPADVDNQTPHTQDEIYIVVQGTGIFNRDGEKIAFAPGDVLFVPAGMEHRFENFSNGFATWVIFYGVDGGEAA